MKKIIYDNQRVMFYLFKQYECTFRNITTKHQHLSAGPLGMFEMINARKQ
jgi:hypothetical protein